MNLFTPSSVFPQVFYLLNKQKQQRQRQQQQRQNKLHT